MKTALIAIIVAAAGSAAFAQTTTTTTTTSSTVGTGTITEYTPGSTMIVKETSGPVTYRYGESVTYVTRDGTTLTPEQVRTRIKVGAPVGVTYTTDGDNRVISRVEIDE